MLRSSISLHMHLFAHVNQLPSACITLDMTAIAKEISKVIRLKLSMHQQISLAKAQSQEARVQAEFSCLTQAYASAQSQLQQAACHQAAQDDSDGSQALAVLDKASQNTIHAAVQDALQQQLPQQLIPLLQEQMSHELADFPATPNRCAGDKPSTMQTLAELQDQLLQLTKCVELSRFQMNRGQQQHQEQQQRQQQQLAHLTHTMSTLADGTTSLKVHQCPVQ